MPFRVMAGHSSDVCAARFHPNDGYVLSASHDGTLRLWDVCSAACVRLLRGHTAAVRDVAVHPEGAYAASASEDGTVLLWHLASGRAQSTLAAHDGPVTRVAFSSNGRLLASASASRLALWDPKAILKEGAPPQPILTSESNEPLLTAAFVPQFPVLVALAQRHVQRGLVPDGIGLPGGVPSWQGNNGGDAKRPRP
uniref:Uncharacterized protein n=1 Tax=Chrysotila carterae TaxID=13221 RepID=A0A7S4C459_CHRCT